MENTVHPYFAPNTSFPHIKKMQHIDIYQNIKLEVYEKQEKKGIEKYIIY